MHRSGDWASTQRGRILTKVHDPTHLSRRTQILIFLGLAVLAVALVFFLNGSFVRLFSIPSGSMEPTLVAGDKVVTTSLVYKFHPPRRGDVVVFHASALGGAVLIKRVVAVGGDTIAVRDGFLYVDGQRQREPYLLGHRTDGDFPSLRVPAGDLFVMGDNRDQSEDSRSFGPIPTSAVIGKALAVWWPLWHLHGL